ncbi:MAG: MBL fold metallo-hydrolase [Pseudomonadota bacterium]
MTDDQNAHAVSWLWDDKPVPGSVTEVVDGISLFRLPLPIRLNHINVYLIEDPNGLVVVDAGFNTADCRDHWHALLEHRDLGDDPRVICTHYHPDHFGLVGFLVDTYGFRVLMPQTEWIVAGFLTRAGAEQIAEASEAFYRRHGMVESLLAQHKDRGNPYQRSVFSVPPDYTRVADGDELVLGGRTFRAITAGGHTPEQLCLYCKDDDLLLSADQILPRITPNTSVFSYNAGANPLGEFLEDFDKFAMLSDDTLVLPGHDRPFRGVQRRIEALKSHHADRLDDVLNWCVDQPRTACELAPLMFQSDLDLHQQMFAIGEIIAHLVLLESRGSVRRLESDGVWRFEAT